MSQRFHAPLPSATDERTVASVIRKPIVLACETCAAEGRATMVHNPDLRAATQCRYHREHCYVCGRRGAEAHRDYEPVCDACDDRVGAEVAESLDDELGPVARALAAQAAWRRIAKRLREEREAAEMAAEDAADAAGGPLAALPEVCRDCGAPTPAACECDGRGADPDEATAHLGGVMGAP